MLIPQEKYCHIFYTGGELISNTLYFELKYGWTGLLVEPNPDELRELYSKHRKSTILPHCLSTKPEVEVVNFDVSKYVSGILVEGKQKPSRMEGDPDRPQMFYERQIEVSHFFILNLNFLRTFQLSSWM